MKIKIPEKSPVMIIIEKTIIFWYYLIARLAMTRIIRPYQLPISIKSKSVRVYVAQNAFYFFYIVQC